MKRFRISSTVISDTMSASSRLKRIDKHIEQAADRLGQILKEWLLTMQWRAP